MDISFKIPVVRQTVEMTRNDILLTNSFLACPDKISKFHGPPNRVNDQFYADKLKHKNTFSIRRRKY